MKKMILLVAVAFCGSTALYAQTEAEMQAWQNFMTPGAMHKLLAQYAGSWDEEVTHWMQPGADPMKSSLLCESKMLLDGRYLETRHTGSFFGMPFVGISLVAYDNAKKIFVSTWIDNMGTGVAVLEGTWNEKTKSLEFIGKSTDPMTGKDVAMREVIRMPDDKTQIVEMYTVYNNVEFKNMEIRLTRKN